MHLVIEKLGRVGIGQSYLLCNLCVGLPSLLLGTNQLKDKLLLFCSTTSRLICQQCSLQNAFLVISPVQSILAFLKRLRSRLAFGAALNVT